VNGAGQAGKPAGRGETTVCNVNDLIKIGIVAAIAVVAFLILWQKGYVVQVRDYVNLTWDELRKCSWPSWEELKGSTVVVTISILILGGFTVVVDSVFFRLLQLLT
jgi:preprotein translocase subunit SecE